MPSARSFFRVPFTWLFRACAFRRCDPAIFLTAFASTFSFDRSDDNPQERTNAASAVCSWHRSYAVRRYPYSKRAVTGLPRKRHSTHITVDLPGLLFTSQLTA